jgi:aminopeptidase N
VRAAALSFDLGAAQTRVQARLDLARTTPGAPLLLDGEQLELLSLALDGRPLAAGDYRLDGGSLEIFNAPDHCVLESEVRLHPEDNTALSGLYASGNSLVTQCEAEGFRRITFFPDRPDVLAVFTITLRADRVRYPVLLSNGNPVAAGPLPDGRHYAVWHDPFPKPSYLFALVAGDLGWVEESFTTTSGRLVPLRIYAQAQHLDQCGHAMASLIKAMRWDEAVYGREYDLDVFNIVAVDDFNMGAMENKGLNIFNAKYILASPATATDSDYAAIEAVVAHEYFHNWSGNRVTCRDWFQLSLKEGFTVFRDQEFTADMGSRGVKRIQDVNGLRSFQFREDAGPMAHPVRPPAYAEINNFYTATVYNKGAEVVRMLRLLLGSEAFRHGTDLYFSRHDGQAVTTDDFVQCMQDVSGLDLSQFKRWYDQAGTPVITASGTYDAAAHRYRLTLEQSCPPSPGQPEKQPFHIPVALGLLGPDGADLPLRLAHEAAAPPGGTRLLHLRETRAEFVFEDLPAAPLPSLLRGFSAPVKLRQERSAEQLALQMAQDSDAFNRWDAAQQLAVQAILAQLPDAPAGHGARLLEALQSAFGRALAAPASDAALLAQVLTLPAESYLGEFLPALDPLALFQARRGVALALARPHRAALLARFHALQEDAPYAYDGASAGRRALKNLCLGYLLLLDEQEGAPDLRALGMRQFEQGRNMTDRMAAASALSHCPGPEREAALGALLRDWRGDPQVMDKWLSLQALSRLPGALDRVRNLMNHPVFSLRNPNKVRALIGAFTQNTPHFHALDGSGYAFLADQVLTLDALNPQVASRLVGVFSPWRRYASPQRGQMQAQLQRIAATPGLSRDVAEITTKSLESAA